MSAETLVQRLLDEDTSMDVPEWCRQSRELRDEAAEEIERLTRERDTAKDIISKCCNALPNGAFCLPGAGLEFMSGIPKEVALVSADLVRRAESAERDKAALVAALSGLKETVKSAHADFANIDRSDLRLFMVIIDAALANMEGKNDG